MTVVHLVNQCLFNLVSSLPLCSILFIKLASLNIVFIAQRVSDFPYVFVSLEQRIQNLVVRIFDVVVTDVKVDDCLVFHQGRTDVLKSTRTDSVVA